MNSKSITILVIFIMTIGAGSFASGHGEGEVELIMVNGAMKAPDLCQNPTKFITINSPLDNQLAYDKQEYQVDKNTCYEIIFHNISPLEHDLTIEEVEGDSGIGFVHLHAINNTVGPSGDGSISQFVQMPDADTEFKAFCTIPGHEAGGMHAIFIVGAGKSDDSGLPGFVLISVIGAVSVLSICKKRKIIE